MCSRCVRAVFEMSPKENFSVGDFAAKRVVLGFDTYFYLELFYFDSLFLYLCRRFKKELKKHNEANALAYGLYVCYPADFRTDKGRLSGAGHPWASCAGVGYILRAQSRRYG